MRCTPGVDATARSMGSVIDFFDIHRTGARIEGRNANAWDRNFWKEIDR